MAKRRLEINWNELLPDKDDEGPPAEVEVVAPAADGGDDATAMVAELEDRQLQEKIQRMAKTLASRIASRLPDGGRKLRTNIRQMQEELDRRKLAGGSRKDAARSCNMSQEKTPESLVVDPIANDTTSESHAKSSFTKRFLQLQEKSDAAFSEELKTIRQEKNINLEKSEPPKHGNKRHQSEMSSRHLRLRPRESSSQSVGSFTHKVQQVSTNASNKDVETYHIPSIEEKRFYGSKRGRTSDHENSNGWQLEVVKEVVILDEEEIQTTHETDGDISDKWKEMKIFYPSRDGPESVELSSADIKCLSPESYLSSTIMNFYILYLQRPQSSIGKSRGEYHFFNTYFYNKLAEAVLCKETDKAACFLKLRRWWKGVSIFQKSYIFIPVHGNLHWSLVIICIPAKEEESGPIVLHLDSLSMHNSSTILNVVERYLKEEWKYVNPSVPSSEFPFTEKIWKNLQRRIEKRKIKVPQQKNEYDCGLFVLYFMERFIEEAPERLKKKDLDMFGSKWFQPEEASGLREKIHSLLLEMFQNANTENNQERSLSRGSSDGED